ncbi:uncharacterized protein LOC114294501 [Camellia sinensis]|uniref:uncharacterized protein LOC114294501 n=1 Tax=Camellia sinensis TaxID=4442 RepID=UPI0010355D6A|nr:uncharacterized protein LOC114294501 [Camellia sinensis]
MGSSESTLLSSKGAVDEITTVSERFQGADPILERLRSLKIATPILTALPTETSLTDMLVRKPSSSSAASGTVNPKVLLELFSVHRDWQEAKAQKIRRNRKQDRSCRCFGG